MVKFYCRFLSNAHVWVLLVFFQDQKDLNLAFITMIKEIAQVTLALFPQSLQRVVGD